MKKVAIQISQQTFDEAVKENIEDFDMSMEDAMRDAIAQFESQGVDLSNIIKHISTDNDQSSSTKSSADQELAQLHNIINILRTISSDQMDEIVRQLDAFLALCEKLPEIKVVAGRNDAIDPLLKLLASPHSTVVDRTSTLLTILCTDCVDNQDFVGQQGMEQIVASYATHAHNKTTIVLLLNLVRATCVKHEVNKSHFAKAEGIQTVCQHLDEAQTDDALSKHMASVFRVVTINDDPKAMFSQAQETIKLLVGYDVIEWIVARLAQYESNPDMLSHWLIVLKQLAITEDHCKKIRDEGGLDRIFRTMQAHHRHLVVVKRCITVLRNVAAADELKTYIITSGGAEEILRTMSTHRNDASLQQHACATLAAIALRSPENSTTLVDMGAGRQIAMTLRAHKSDTSVIRQSALAIRNMVARCAELRPRLLEEDIEELLQEAQQYRNCGDEAYAALRDLGCKIQLSTFGSGTHRARFNPVQEQSNKLLEAVDEAAEAPFASYS